MKPHPCFRVEFQVTTKEKQLFTHESNEIRRNIRRFCQWYFKRKKIVEAEKESVIVVVSALSDVTDQLYRVSKLASDGNEEYLTEYQSMLQRHINVIEAVVPRDRLQTVLEQVKVQFNDLSNILRGIF